MHRTHRHSAALGGATGVILALLLVVGCAGTAPVTGSPRVPANAAAYVAPEHAKTPGEAQYGIRYESLRLSGAGLLLDFRYRVLDPSKAAHVVNRKLQPYVEDVLTGHRFQVPHAQKVGTLRHMGGNLQTGRVYSMLFANPGRTIKSGGKVNVVIGGYRLDELMVE